MHNVILPLNLGKCFLCVSQTNFFGKENQETCKAANPHYTFFIDYQEKKHERQTKQDFY